MLPDGSGKADVNPDKMTLGSTATASIPLFPAVDGLPLIIAEGIENALSCSHAFQLPAWSSIAAGNMPAMVLPPIVREVIIAADRDPAGERAAREAAWKWFGAGLRVRVMLPPSGAGDWNDMALQGML